MINSTDLRHRKKLNAVLMIILLFPLLAPYSVMFLLPKPAVHVLDAVAGISSLVLAVYYVQYRLLDKLTVLVAVHCSVMLLATCLNGGSLYAPFATSWDYCFIKNVGICLAVGLLLSVNPKEYTELLYRYYFFLVVINLLSILLFPNGIYVSAHTENYVLGYDNSHTRTFYLAIALALYRDRLNGHKDLSRETKLLLLLVNVSVFLRLSSTTVTQTVLFDILILFRKRLCRLRVINAYSAALVNLFFSLFLVLVFRVKSNSLIAYIAVNVFHKDATLTIRTYIWDNAIKAIGQKPLLGHGMNADAAAGALRGFVHAHNEYLTELYYGGIVLLAVLLIIIFLVARSLERYRRFDDDLISYSMVAVYFAVMFHWNTESLYIMLQLATFAVLYQACSPERLLADRRRLLYGR